MKINAILLVLLWTEVTFQNCPSNTLQCSSEQKAIECDLPRGYKLNAADNTCEVLQISNCDIIESDGSCTRCKSDYYPSGDTCNQMPSADQVKNGKYYDVNKQCTECENNYFVSGGACELVLDENKIANCSIQEAQAICHSCKTGFTLNAAKSACIALPALDNCRSYGDFSCKQCDDDFFLNENYYQHTWREEPGESSLSRIAKFQLYYREFNKVPVYGNVNMCQAVQLSNCVKLASFNTCEVCEDNYYVDQNNKCTRNPSTIIKECLVYTNATACKKCNQGYRLKTSKCIAVTAIDFCKVYLQDQEKTQCAECNSGYFHQSQGSICVERGTDLKSIAGCEQYALDGDYCKKCAIGKTGTFQSQNQFLTCIDRISQCKEHQHSGSSLTCKVCEDGFYRENATKCSNGTVTKCAVYKQTVTNTIECVTCEQGWYETGSGSSKTCEPVSTIQDCQRYSLTTNNLCEVCNDGLFKFKLKQKCTSSLQSIGNCITYQQNNNNEGDSLCLACATGFYLKSNKKECLQVSVESTNCQTLKLEANGTKTDDCEVCLLNYGLQETDGSSAAITCERPLKVIERNCETSSGSTNFVGKTKQKISSVNLAREMLCEKCDADSFPINLMNHTVCIDRDRTQFLKKNHKAKVTSDSCGVFKKDGSTVECMNCIRNHIMEGGSGKTCAEFQTNELSCAGKGVVALQNEGQIQYLNVNRCHNAVVAGAELLSMSLTTGSVVVAQCKSDRQPKIDYTNIDYTNIDLTSSNITVLPDKWVNNLGVKNPVVACAKVGSVGTKEKYFIEDDMAARCKYQFTGKNVVTKVEASSDPNPTNHIDCTVDISCKTGLQGMPLFWEKVSSCHICSEAQKVSVVFGEMDAVTVTDTTLTFSPYTLNDQNVRLNSVLVADKDDVRVRQQCLNSNETIIKNEAGIVGTDVMLTVSNCGLYFANNDGTADDTTANSGKNIFCAYCKPGYYPEKTVKRDYNTDDTEDTGSFQGDTIVNLTFVHTCTVVPFCDVNVPQFRINGCSQCRENYAFKYKDVLGNSQDIDYEECVKQSVGGTDKNVQANCYALDNTRQNCALCKKGFNLTSFNTCVEFIERQVCSNFFYNPQNTLKYEDGNLDNLTYMHEGFFGCDVCVLGSQVALFVEDDYFGIPQNYCFPIEDFKGTNGINQTQAANVAGSIFITKCKHYHGYLSNNDSNAIATCAQCEPEYILSENKQRCVQLSSIENCKIAANSLNSCHQCENTFGIYQTNLNNQTVKQCARNDINNCLLLYDIYDNSVDVASYTKCQTCEQGYYQANFKKECRVSNVLNCRLGTVDNPNKCQNSVGGLQIDGCMNGFFHIEHSYIISTSNIGASLTVARDYCMPIPNVMGCSKASLNGSKQVICERCTDIFQFQMTIDDGVNEQEICQPFGVIPNCEEYLVDNPDVDDVQLLSASNFSCTQCKSLYYRVKNGYECKRRVNVPQSCLEFDPSNDKCTKCRENFFLSGQECMAYPDGEEGCGKFAYQNNKRVCVTCIEDKYFMETTNQGIKVCTLATAPVTNCIKILNHTKCQICEANYFKTSTQTECQSADATPNCASLTSVNSCNLCNPGFRKKLIGSEQKCDPQPDAQCTSWTDENCNTCTTSFFPDKSSTHFKCTEADSIPNCDIFETKTKCRICAKAYALALDQLSCIETSGVTNWDGNCRAQKKGSSLTCNECYPGFFLRNGECVDGSGSGAHADGCLIPDAFSGKCKMCRNGYEQLTAGVCSSLSKPTGPVVTIGVGVYEMGLMIVFGLLAVF